MTRIAIIGAGLSGLILAHQLKSRVHATLFEKSRGVGGRMATRYASPYQFDHGAQFFVARTEEFQFFLQPLIAKGIVVRWDAKFAELNQGRTIEERRWNDEFPHFVAVPGMNQLGKHLAREVDVRLQQRVTAIKAGADGWQLLNASNDPLGNYDWVVTTVPPAQAVELLPESFSHSQALSDTKMLGCYALLLGMRTPMTLPWQAALVHEADISWISVNSSKPGRSGNFSLLAHATNGWSEAHMEDHVNDVKNYLTHELSDLIGFDLLGADYRMVHRWRYANIGKQHGPTMYLDDDALLAACGDWCIQGRVEAAFISATRLAEALKSRI